MTLQTRSQRLAQAAYAQVSLQGTPDKGPDKEYVSFAKKFPALIHTCGLAQAVAFALAKGKSKDERKGPKPELRYLDGLAEVLRLLGHDGVDSPKSLDKASRDIALGGYPTRVVVDPSRDRTRLGPFTRLDFSDTDS